MAAQEAQIKNGALDHGDSEAAVIFSCLKPMLFVAAPNGADAVQFYRTAFGAEEVSRTVHPKRKADQELPHILTAELKIGSSFFIVSDNEDDSTHDKKSGFIFCLETDDVPAAVAKAVAAGAVKSRQDAKEAKDDAISGCCSPCGKVKDPYGFVWHFCAPAAAKATDVSVA